MMRFVVPVTAACHQSMCRAAGGFTSHGKTIFMLWHALQVLKNSGVGDAFNNIGKQLKDGHWVLAFPNVEAANYATLLVDQHAAKLRAYYCEACSDASHPSTLIPMQQCSSFRRGFVS